MMWHIYKESESELHLRGDQLCPCYPRTHVLENGDFLVIHNTVDGIKDESSKTINLAINYILNKKADGGVH